MENNAKNVNPQAKKTPESGLAKASLILGILSFIPMIGAEIGIAAIVLGIIALSKKRKSGLNDKKSAVAGVVLGVLGILFTVFFYSLCNLAIIRFVSKGGPGETGAKNLVQQMVNCNAQALELYKKSHGRYPVNLKDLPKRDKYGFPLTLEDPYLQSLYYKVSSDGQTYELRSLGPDRKYGTADDILPKK